MLSLAVSQWTLLPSRRNGPQPAPPWIGLQRPNIREERARTLPWQHSAQAIQGCLATRGFFTRRCVLSKRFCQPRAAKALRPTTFAFTSMVCDENGSWLLKRMTEDGVSISGVQTLKGEATATLQNTRPRRLGREYDHTKSQSKQIVEIPRPHCNQLFDCECEA